ncbi:MAG: hypothetical protein J0G97_06515, partial [Rhizobium pusense]|nr:hypothetical protein [Agrobacterium pusense]
QLGKSAIQCERRPMSDTNLEQLERIIFEYINSRNNWLATAKDGEDLVSDGECFEGYQTAARAVLLHPCSTLTAVRRKTSFIYETADLCVILREDDDGDSLRIFLCSLIIRNDAPDSHN